MRLEIGHFEECLSGGNPETHLACLVPGMNTVVHAIWHFAPEPGA